MKITRPTCAEVGKRGFWGTLRDRKGHNRNYNQQNRGYNNKLYDHDYRDCEAGKHIYQDKEEVGSQSDSANVVYMNRISMIMIP